MASIPLSQFGYGNGPFRANFDTGFTAQALIHVHRVGFAVNHCKDLGRAGVYTFFIAIAFVFVHINLPHNSNLLGGVYPAALKENIVRP
jgi:hypothetical protein